DGIQIPVRHSRGLPRAQLQHVSARARLQRARHGSVFGITGGGIRGRGRWLHCDQTSARSRYRLLRCSGSGHRGREIFNHRFARLDGTRPVPLSRPRMSLTSSPISPERADLTDSRLAALCAETVQRAFLEYDERFRAITLRARERFLARDWRGSYADAAERLRLYAQQMEKLTEQFKKIMGTRLSERSVWTGMKAVYSSLIAQSPKREIAESFFNSLTRRVFATEGVDQAIEFVDTDFYEAPTTPLDNRRTYSGASIHELLIASLTDPAAGFPEEHWRELDTTARHAAERLQAAFRTSPEESPTNRNLRLEMIGNVFYRGRGAYLVGRAFRDRDDQNPVAIALCLRHEAEAELDLDALLIGETDLAILFSFTRAYFRVDTACPYELVRSLRELMPRKRLIDLYNAIGYHRHGKTEFYRDFVRHLGNSNDRFVAAEGARGMVMLVFTLPSYDVVFKLIRDHFDYPKESTRAEVMRR